jgi:large subunit ribosomal protein L14
MKPIKTKVTKGFVIGSTMPTCDNSGAKIVRIVGIKRQKTVKKRMPAAGIADLVLVSVKSGTKEMRKKVFPGIVVRQRKSYRRPGGMWIKFEDNAIVVLKDEKGNPKGTIFKGPIAKEACERWPAVAKLAKIVV